MAQDGENRAGVVHVRAARRADHDTLVAHVAAGALESEGRALSLERVAVGVASSLAEPAHRAYHVAERDGAPVGSCLVTTEWSDWNANWTWWLQSIYVEPPARGTGVLEALLAHVEAEARRAGVGLVRLYVHEANTRARRAYERVGYRETAYRVYEHDM